MTLTERQVWDLLAEVPDPELPAVSVVDLGIARAVEVSPDGAAVRVDITPTYSGCPAMRAIEDDVRRTLARRFPSVDVRTVLSPPWTTDWISEAGREKLRAHGIAPPGSAPGSPSGAPTGVASGGRALLPLTVAGRPDACPHCGSADVEVVSEFGSTACKAAWRCRACAEPFDHFKRH